jgi:hypothetical protein
MVRNYDACMYMFLEVLRLIRVLTKSSEAADVKNGQILMNAVFSKEFSKIIKIGFDYSDPRVTSKKSMERMINCQSVFFELLSIYASDRVLTLQTNKQVRNKFKDVKKKAKKRAKHTAVDGTTG